MSRQSIASAMLMTLDPCNLAITRAQWVTSDGAPPFWESPATASCKCWPNARGK